jgi:hypothetical protein
MPRAVHQRRRVKGVGNLLMNTVYLWCHCVLRHRRLPRCPGPMPDPFTLQTSYYPYPYFISSSPDLFTLISQRFTARKHTPSCPKHKPCNSHLSLPSCLPFFRFTFSRSLFSFLLLGLFKTSHISLCLCYIMTLQLKMLAAVFRSYHVPSRHLPV